MSYGYNSGVLTVISKRQSLCKMLQREAPRGWTATLMQEELLAAVVGRPSAAWRVTTTVKMEDRIPLSDLCYLTGYDGCAEVSCEFTEEELAKLHHLIRHAELSCLKKALADSNFQQAAQTLWPTGSLEHVAMMHFGAWIMIRYVTGVETTPGTWFTCCNVPRRTTLVRIAPETVPKKKVAGAKGPEKTEDPKKVGADPTCPLVAPKCFGSTTSPTSPTTILPSQSNLATPASLLPSADGKPLAGQSKTPEGADATKTCSAGSVTPSIKRTSKSVTVPARRMRMPQSLELGEVNEWSSLLRTLVFADGAEPYAATLRTMEKGVRDLRKVVMSSNPSQKTQTTNKNATRAVPACIVEGERPTEVGDAAGPTPQDVEGSPSSAPPSKETTDVGPAPPQEEGGKTVPTILVPEAETQSIMAAPVILAPEAPVHSSPPEEAAQPSCPEATSGQGMRDPPLQDVSDWQEQYEESSWASPAYEEQIRALSSDIQLAPTVEEQSQSEATSHCALVADWAEWEVPDEPTVVNVPRSLLPQPTVDSPPPTTRHAEAQVERWAHEILRTIDDGNGSPGHVGLSRKARAYLEKRTSEPQQTPDPPSVSKCEVYGRRMRMPCERAGPTPGSSLPSTVVGSIPLPQGFLPAKPEDPKRAPDSPTLTTTEEPECASSPAPPTAPRPLPGEEQSNPSSYLSFLATPSTRTGMVGCGKDSSLDGLSNPLQNTTTTESSSESDGPVWSRRRTAAACRKLSSMQRTAKLLRDESLTRSGARLLEELAMPRAHGGSSQATSSQAEATMQAMIRVGTWLPEQIRSTWSQTQVDRLTQVAEQSSQTPVPALSWGRQKYTSYLASGGFRKMTVQEERMEMVGRTCIGLKKPEACDADAKSPPTGGGVGDEEATKKVVPQADPVHGGSNPIAAALLGKMNPNRRTIWIEIDGNGFLGVLGTEFDKQTSQDKTELVGVVTGPMKDLPNVYTDSADNITQAILNRYTLKAKPNVWTNEDKKKVGAVIRNAMSNGEYGIWSKKKIKEWAERKFHLNDLKSKKWSDKRMSDTIDACCRVVDPYYKFKTKVKLEHMPEGKPPRFLIIDGDEGTVMALLTICCFEDLLFDHFGKKSIKKANRREAIERCLKELKPPKNKGDDWSTVEGDGTAWDTTCNETVRGCIENPILYHIVGAITECGVVPECWHDAHLESCTKSELKLRFKKNMDVVFTKIGAIRRSGHRGTSCLNWWVNYVMWICCLFDDPSNFLLPNVRNGKDIHGVMRWWNGCFEGDDSLCTTSPRLPPYTIVDGKVVLHEHVQAFVDFWSRGGFDMKFIFCSTRATFVGTHIVCEDGRLGDLYCPELPRALRSAVCSSPLALEVLKAAKPGTSVKLLTIMAATAMGRAADFAGILPTVSKKYLQYALSIRARSDDFSDRELSFHGGAEPGAKIMYSAVADLVDQQNAAVTPTDELKRMELLGYGIADAIELDQFVTYDWHIHKLGDHDGFRASLPVTWRQ